MDSRATIIN